MNPLERFRGAVRKVIVLNKSKETKKIKIIELINHIKALKKQQLEMALSPNNNTGTRDEESNGSTSQKPRMSHKRFAEFTSDHHRHSHLPSLRNSHDDLSDMKHLHVLQTDLRHEVSSIKASLSEVTATLKKLVGFMNN